MKTNSLIISVLSMRQI